MKNCKQLGKRLENYIPLDITELSNDLIGHAVIAGGCWLALSENGEKATLIIHCIHIKIKGCWNL